MPWRASRSFVLEPPLPAPLLPLARLARNMCWSWMAGAASLFERIDPALWQATGHNPVRMLQAVDRLRFEQLAADQTYIEQLNSVSHVIDRYLETPWQAFGPLKPEHPVAYFSFEFAIAESLPNYAGGLGVLAGDHVKSASDLAVPLVGVGLFYRQGYFRQVLGPDGWQSEQYPDIDPMTQPFTRMIGADGLPLDIQVEVGADVVHCAVWRLDVGRVPLYLLDSNVPANRPDLRELTSRLYGGDQAIRVAQELILGIGGVRMLHALGITPSVCHMNEGHSALLGFERARLLTELHACGFEEAQLAVAASTTFTTHTAVEAGIDIFPVELAQDRVRPTYERLGLTPETFADLGQDASGADERTFSMAVLGIKMSTFRNGVSYLHASVARRLWHPVWPMVPEEQVPIDAVNNGVHLPTWVAPEMAAIFDNALGPAWREHPEAPESWRGMGAVADETLWAARSDLRHRLAVQTREAISARAQRLGMPGRMAGLDPNALTIGFARRFATYKRAALLFRDPARLAEILSDPDRPVQVVFAGKAHPKDDAGKAVIREVSEFARRPEFNGRVFVLEQYDVALARALVQGCDIWLNTPVRPLEASGTSGMKAVANGGLHFSVLDGWWADSYQPGLGWTIGGESASSIDRAAEDDQESVALYDVLEREIVPLFYDRSATGVPSEWVRRVKGSIAAYAPRFNTHRMVREYTERSYVPAATAWDNLTGGGMEASRRLHEWLRHVRSEWTRVRVVQVDDSVGERHTAQAPVGVSVTIDCGGLRPEDLAVEIAYGEADESGILVSTSTARCEAEASGDPSAWRYHTRIDPRRSGRFGYAVRVSPAHPDLRSPLDLGLVQWA